MFKLNHGKNLKLKALGPGACDFQLKTASVEPKELARWDCNVLTWRIHKVYFHLLCDINLHARLASTLPDSKQPAIGGTLVFLMKISFKRFFKENMLIDMKNLNIHLKHSEICSAGITCSSSNKHNRVVSMGSSWSSKTGLQVVRSDCGWTGELGPGELIGPWDKQLPRFLLKSPMAISRRSKTLEASDPELRSNLSLKACGNLACQREIKLPSIRTWEANEVLNTHMTSKILETSLIQSKQIAY